jgi:hypothetical protein
MNHLSKSTLSAFIVLALAGLLSGWRAYSHRSTSIIEKHINGSNAISLHVTLAMIVLIFLICYAIYRLGHHSDKRVLSAPFADVAYSRFKYTITLKGGVSFMKTLQLVVTLMLILFMAFNIVRGTAQVFAALDPNFTVNAWGGPSYWGASLAHWLDGVIFFYIGASLLNMVMLKNKEYPHHS